ncbi:MAG: hypothetical protein RR292_06625 [Christensenellaceae bacterium]
MMGLFRWRVLMSGLWEDEIRRNEQMLFCSNVYDCTKKSLAPYPQSRNVGIKAFIKIAIQSKSNRKSDFGLYQRCEN